MNVGLCYANHAGRSPEGRPEDIPIIENLVTDSYKTLLP